jgi:hypothetical protein
MIDVIMIPVENFNFSGVSSEFTGGDDDMICNTLPNFSFIEPGQFFYGTQITDAFLRFRRGQSALFQRLLHRVIQHTQAEHHGSCFTHAKTFNRDFSGILDRTFEYNQL